MDKNYKSYEVKFSIRERRLKKWKWRVKWITEDKELWELQRKITGRSDTVST
jgi:hypothetical protein